jgi:ferritin-like protein
MATHQLHEPAEHLSPEIQEMHRALISLIEELEAVDWYGQRVAATDDEQLRLVLEHNRDEEKEHACMTLEWIRRRDPAFDRHLRRFLFQPDSDAIVGNGLGADEATPTLRIGSLRCQEEERA